MPTQNALQDAVSHLEHLKTEHRTLLDQIVSDAGMAPETRRTLVAHVLEEEAEQLSKISALVSASPSPAMGAATSAQHLPSVGSLRQDASIHLSTVGSLRKQK